MLYYENAEGQMNTSLPVTAVGAAGGAAPLQSNLIAHSGIQTSTSPQLHPGGLHPPRNSLLRLPNELLEMTMMHVQASAGPFAVQALRHTCSTLFHMRPPTVSTWHRMMGRVVRAASAVVRAVEHDQTLLWRVAQILVFVAPGRRQQLVDMICDGPLENEPARSIGVACVRFGAAHFSDAQLERINDAARDIRYPQIAYRPVYDWFPAQPLINAMDQVADSTVPLAFRISAMNTLSQAVLSDTVFHALEEHWSTLQPPQQFEVGLVVGIMVAIGRSQIPAIAMMAISNRHASVEDRDGYVQNLLRMPQAELGAAIIKLKPALAYFSESQRAQICAAALALADERCRAAAVSALGSRLWLLPSPEQEALVAATEPMSPAGKAVAVAGLIPGLQTLVGQS